MIAPAVLRAWQRERLLNHLGLKLSGKIESDEAREDRLDRRYEEIWQDEPIARPVRLTDAMS